VGGRCVLFCLFFFFFAGRGGGGGGGVVLRPWSSYGLNSTGIECEKQARNLRLHTL